MRYWSLAKDPERWDQSLAAADRFYRENFQRLRALLNLEKPYDRLMAAEVSRELGDFDEAARFLSYDSPDEYSRLATVIKSHTEQRDSKVRAVVAMDSSALG